MKLNLPLKCIGIFILLVTCSLQVFSQPNWISPISHETLPLNSFQQSQIERLRKHPHIHAVTPIQINPIRTSVTNGALVFRIPGEQKPYVFTPSKVQYQDDQNYVWRGNLKGAQIFGDLVIMAKEGAVFGRINTEERSFIIQDLKQGQNILIEYKKKGLELPSCGTTNEATSTKPNYPATQDRSSLSGGGVRVLVVYTPAAENFTNPSQLASLYMNDLNAIMANSDLSSTTLRFALAGVEPWNYVEQPNDPRRDRLNLVNDPNVNALRESTQADIVVALTLADYRDRAIWPIGGLSTVDVNNPEDAHALVRVDLPADNYTFSHEIAHMFNCRHDIINDPDGPTGAHGHLFSSGSWPFRKYWRTLMGVSNNTRIPFASNPLVLWQGTRTGSFSQEYNAKQLRLFAPTVCNYRAYADPMSATIGGPQQVSSGDTKTWCATITNCSQTPSYQWEYSTDGFAYTYAGNSACISRSMPFGKDLYLRLTVSCLNQEDVVVFYHVINSDAGPCSPCRQEAAEPSITPTKSFEIYPNPSESIVNISLFGFRKGEKTIQILSILGGEVYRQITIRNNRVTLPISLPPGTYVLQVKQEETLLRQILIIK